MANPIVQADPKTTYAGRIADIPDAATNPEPDEDESTEPEVTTSQATKRTNGQTSNGGQTATGGAPPHKLNGSEPASAPSETIKRGPPC